jgi:tRNA A37 N6-isopentenylltransferase MiaA
MSASATTITTVSAKTLQQRIRRTARKHSHIVSQDGRIMILTGETMLFLLCLGDEDNDLPREQQLDIARWLQRLVERNIHAKVIWPRDWPDVQHMIETGDWRN